MPMHRRQNRRSGAVLLAVLVTIVILSLMAYQYSDRMTSEYQAAYNSHKYAQARSFADSGFQYTAALLASPDNITNLLGGNPYNNPDMFANILVPDSESKGNAGRFTLVAANDPNNSTGSYRAGVTDENGKININSFIKIDPTGNTLYAMLQKLPNMTPDIAASIVNWVLPSSATPIDGGALDDYYTTLSPSYQCKHGPFDTIDELLLVRGVTRELLFGSDLNRNGINDPDETSASGSVDRGWIDFLTVYSREPNRDDAGHALVWINDTDITTLYENLSSAVGEDLAKFIILYRQYGPSNTAGTQQSLVSSLLNLVGVQTKPAATTTTVQGVLANYQVNLQKKPAQTFSTYFDMITAQVSVAGTGQGTKTTIYTSPLTSPDQIAALLPILIKTTTLTQDAEIPARININTAPPEVLACLPNFTETDLTTILAARPQYSANQPIADNFKTIGWLFTDANIKVAVMRKMEKMLTTRSQVYHMMVVGSFDNQKGPTGRIEAIIDQNYGRPRIVFWRDWSELGKTNLPPQ